jgi:hypothetical protein
VKYMRTHSFYSSGKHKIVSGRSNERLDFGSGTKETVMPKKKVIDARNLKDWTKFEFTTK